MYKFAKLKEVSKLIDDGKTIDFTLDERGLLSYDEPTEWYGASITRMFDGWTFLIGYYGDGIVYFNTVDSLIGLREFLNINGMKEVDELCIDIGGDEKTSTWELLEAKRDGKKTVVALVDRHTEYDRYVVAWGFDEQNAAWEHGHYFGDIESAKEYYKKKLQNYLTNSCGGYIIRP